MNNTRKFIMALALSAFASAASAVPITGSIGFDGAYERDGTSLADATTITITDAMVSGITTGSFLDAGITAGDAASYSDFTIGAAPIASIWTVGIFTFDLSSMSVDFRNASSLVLSGNGVFRTTDSSLDSANGEWTFTANNTVANLTWSSSAGVPEPALTLLLATGLIGFGFARRARKAA